MGNSTSDTPMQSFPAAFGIRLGTGHLKGHLGYLGYVDVQPDKIVAWGVRDLTLEKGALFFGGLLGHVASFVMQKEEQGKVYTFVVYPAEGTAIYDTSLRRVCLPMPGRQCLILSMAREVVGIEHEGVFEVFLGKARELLGGRLISVSPPEIKGASNAFLVACAILLAVLVAVLILSTS